MPNKLKLTVKTFQGLENVLANELKNLGATDIKILKRAVSVTGTLKEIYRFNYQLRTGVKVLQEIISFEATNADELYTNVKRVQWEKYFDLKDTFAINSVVYSENFNHSGYAGLKVKDAIADYFREKFGERPNVWPKDPDFRVELHISGSTCTLSVDTTGDPLFKRGYRKFTGLAPLSEILAAGMLLLTNFEDFNTFIDPMCGSGTLLTEAAMIHLRIPAAIHREHFALERVNNFDEKLWAEVKSNAIANIKKTSDIIFLGFDIDARTANTAALNVKNASLEGYIEIKKGDFLTLEKPAEKGIIVTNPPYDMRIKNKNIIEFYKLIGDKLKQDFQNWDAWLISGNKTALKNVGLRPTLKHQLLNGAVPANFNKYELYLGSKKIKQDIK